jgi:hypothetical protein
MLSADELSFTSQDVHHCGQPMRYRNSRTTWEGQPTEGEQITETVRICRPCGAVLTVTLREPS